MVIHLKIRSAAARVILLFGLVVVAGFLILRAVETFVVSTFSDERAPVDSDLLESSLVYFGNSGRLFAKAAEIELNGPSPDLNEAEENAQRAIARSPYDHNRRLLLYQIRLVAGNKEGAQRALYDALSLAPNDHVVHWQLANFLVSVGKIDESLEHFRVATALNPLVLPQALEIVWNTSGQSVKDLGVIVGGEPSGQLRLFVFLAERSHVEEAVEAFNRVDRAVLLASPNTSPFIDTLIAKGHPKLASALWLRLVTGSEESSQTMGIWNGDFESSPVKDLKQFEWHLQASKFARVGIDNTTAHSGRSSLLIDFLGVDTTSLENEVSHLIVLRPEVAHQLVFYAKTQNFISPSDGPSVVISLASEPATQVAHSSPITSGTQDWKKMTIDFRSPKTSGDGVLLIVSVTRKPRYAYDEPTRGRIWLDDFSVYEVGRG